VSCEALESSLVCVGACSLEPKRVRRHRSRPRSTSETVSRSRSAQRAAVSRKAMSTRRRPRAELCNCRRLCALISRRPAFVSVPCCSRPFLRRRWRHVSRSGTVSRPARSPFSRVGASSTHLDRVRSVLAAPCARPRWRRRRCGQARVRLGVHRRTASGQPRGLGPALRRGRRQRSVRPPSATRPCP